MRLTINRADNYVGIDGMFYQINCSILPPNLRVVQWSGTIGHEEWTDQENTMFDDIGKYQAFVDTWVSMKAESDARDADPYYGMSADEKKAAQEREIRVNYGQMMREVTKPYQDEERETWPTQVKEAEQWMADNSAPCWMIRAVANMRGITIELMVEKILASEERYRRAVGSILGAQQAAIDVLFPERKEEV